MTYGFSSVTHKASKQHCETGMSNHLCHVKLVLTSFISFDVADHLVFLHTGTKLVFGDLPSSSLPPIHPGQLQSLLEILCTPFEAFFI